MISRIDVQYLVPDARAEVKKREFEALGLRGKLSQVSIVDSYTIEAKLKPAVLAKAAGLFADQNFQKVSVNRPLSPRRFSYAVEIGFLPGVTDNVGATAKETLEDYLGKYFRPGEGVYSSQVFFISGRLAAAEAERIANFLHNPLIQRASLLPAGEFRKQRGFPKAAPRVRLTARPEVSEVDLWVDEEELRAIGAFGIKNQDGSRRGPLALDLEALKTIRSHFHKLGRNPTDVELEALAQTWSEHCKHTIFADPLDEVRDGVFKGFIKRATEQIRRRKGNKDFCVSVFQDNSGGIEFDEDYLLTHKVETHNTPSALDPFGGAVTGIVGVNRDALGFGLGAKPVINTYGFCVAEPGDNRRLYRRENGEGALFSAREALNGVVRGVAAGGNQSGIPTPQGFVRFDESFRGKPLVFVGTVGLLPKTAGGRKLHEKQARPGDYIVMIGGRVGLDGIHGATFSSVALDSGSPAAAVQIGDPITQKKLSDALVREARDRGLYHSITDNGAGGLSCSVAEMARESGGCVVDLKKVPLKYPGLVPWQIWISESQERMTLAVPKQHWGAFWKLMNSRGVEAARIGVFTDTGRCVVKYGRRLAMDLSLDFLHEGRPIKRQISAETNIAFPEPQRPKLRNWSKVILALLKRPNLASHKFISQQYDHEVQGTSVTKPLQGRGLVNADSTITRPRFDSWRGAVLAHGIYPWYANFSAYDMAACGIDEAVRAAAAAGADLQHLALLDNFCWPSGNDPERLGQLKRAAQACYDVAVAYGTPFISGKDSMFNDFQGFDAQGRPVKVSILPTLLISAIGVIKDIRRAVTLDAKFPGDAVYMLGETFAELGASEYQYYLRDKQSLAKLGGRVPRVSARKNYRLYRALQACIEDGLIASAVSLGRGGLAAALCRTAMAGDLGLRCSLKRLPGMRALPADLALFSESQGRILVTVSPKKSARFERALKGLKFGRLGEITAEKAVKITGRQGEAAASFSVAQARRAYHSAFRHY